MFRQILSPLSLHAVGRRHHGKRAHGRNHPLHLGTQPTLHAAHQFLDPFGNWFTPHRFHRAQVVVAHLAETLKYGIDIHKGEDR